MSMFHGLSAFPITPFDAQGHVATDALAAILTRIEAAGVSSIGLLGSTGSYVYLTREERLRATKAAVSAITNTPLIVGIGALATRDVLALAQDAQSAGADGLLLAPVSYTPLTHDEAFAHYKTIATATDLPICIYNNPGTTHFNFDLPLLQKLADIPNIQAIKMPLPTDATIADDLAGLRAGLRADFAIGYSADWGCGPAMLAGADAFYSGIAGVLPQVMQNLVNAGQAGDAASVDAQQAQLAPLWAQVKVHGGMRTSYTIARHLGLTTALPPAPVQLPPSDAEALIVAALNGLELS